MQFEGWLNTCIDDNIEFSGGAQPPREVFSDEPKENYIRLIQIRDYKTDKFATYIPKNLARKFCSKTDIMIGRYGPPIFQILRGIEGAYNVALIKAIPKKGVNQDFMYYFLKQESLLNVIDSHSQRTSGQTGIEMDVLKSFPMPLPPIQEQKKIAEILSTWDKAIETVEKLVANSQQQKKALMQQLLTGQKRLLDENGVKFGDEWEKTNLKNLLKEEKARNRDKAITRVLSVTNHSGFVLPENHFSKRVASDEVSNYKVVKKGQFGYNPSRINVGSFARLDDFDSGILSPMYVVFEISTPKLDSDFFNFWMQSHEAKQRINNSTQGSVRDSVGFDAMASFPFKLPTIKEQEKIAQVLTLADREIDLYNQQLDKLKLEKKSLMQQLLTGQKRVKTD